MRHEKTGRAYERALGVTYRLLNKCAEEREKMNDDCTPGWRMVTLTPMPLNTFQGSTRFAISGKGTHILRTEQGNVNFQYDRSKQAYVMHPNVHHKLEKYGDTFAEQ